MYICIYVYIYIYIYIYICIYVYIYIYRYARICSHFGSSQLGARRTGSNFDVVADPLLRVRTFQHRPLGGDLSAAFWHGTYAAHTFGRKEEAALRYSTRPWLPAPRAWAFFDKHELDACVLIHLSSLAN